jgi:hypothetical protein
MTEDRAVLKRLIQTINRFFDLLDKARSSSIVVSVPPEVLEKIKKSSYTS